MKLLQSVSKGRENISHRLTDSGWEEFYLSIQRKAINQGVPFKSFESLKRK